MGEHKRIYPGRVAIRHVIESARACGLDVAGVSVSPDGTIKILEARASQSSESLFDRLEREGRI